MSSGPRIPRIRCEKCGYEATPKAMAREHTPGACLVVQTETRMKLKGWVRADRTAAIERAGVPCEYAPSSARSATHDLLGRQKEVKVHARDLRLGDELIAQPLWAPKWTHKIHRILGHVSTDLAERAFRLANEGEETRQIMLAAWQLGGIFAVQALVRSSKYTTAKDARVQVRRDRLTTDRLPKNAYLKEHAP